MKATVGSDADGHRAGFSDVPPAPSFSPGCATGSAAELLLTGAPINSEWPDDPDDKVKK